MDFLSSLNPEQREAALHREEPLLIPSPVLDREDAHHIIIAYLIGDGHAEPGQVLGDLHQQGSR
jgi:superfamily I DNA/RNA helicase